MVLEHLTNCKVLSTVRQSEDLEGWKAVRTRGIGGSDVGAICGVHKYATPRTVYLKKTGQYEEDFDDASKERMYWGHVLEPLVADEFQRRTGKKVVESPATLVHKDHAWAIANVDRFIVDDNGVPYGILECKTASSYMEEDWEEGNVPLYYLYQLRWYMWITGLKYGAIACLVGGNKYFYFEIYEDEEVTKSIVETCSHFWNHYVQNLIEPPLTGNDVDSDLVSSKYQDVVKNSEKTLDDEESDQLASKVLALKKQIKVLEEQLDEAKNQLMEKLQETEIGYTVNHIIKWSPRQQTRVDTDRLKTEYPDIYNKVKKVTKYRVFSVKSLGVDD